MRLMKMKKYTNRLNTTLGAITTAFGVAVAYATSTFASAASEIGAGANSTGQTGGVTFQQGVETVTNILLFIIGLVAVIMIIIGGIRYTTSNGDASQTKAAKDTILYSIVGLVVAIMAYAIVRWVVNTFA